MFRRLLTVLLLVSSALFSFAAQARASSGHDVPQAGQTGPYGQPPWREYPGGGTGDNGVHGVQKWSSDVTAMNADVAAHPSAPLVFIGDSITYRWQTIGASIWDSTWAPEGALDLGIGGDTTQNVLQRLDADKELGALHPAAAVVLIGTNDFHHGWSPAQVAFGITRVARTLQAKLPTTEIELVSLLPRSDSSVEAADVVATNAILDATHFGPRIAYNDFYPDFVTSTGAQVPGDFNPLGVHPTAQGYAEELSLLQAIPAVASA